MKNSNNWVLDLQQTDKTMQEQVGGKGANLGELSRITGIRVPDGFCITTDAFKKVMDGSPQMGALLERLSGLKLEDRTGIIALGTAIREAIEAVPVPTDMQDEIFSHLSRLGVHKPCAVRSSATAEDLPGASFAGQQDTFLNIKGEAAILEHIAKCWASLFTERAIIYRIQNGFDHRKVYLSVVVQQMIFPQAAGILFTADPVTGNRKVSVIDAGFGLGEAMVSGLVNADHYKICEGIITDKKVQAKKKAVYALEEGGTEVRELEQELQEQQALADDQLLELDRLGRKIEAHFGNPQDIEWCRANDSFYIVQSRPVTTLFPIPENPDPGNHVYVSVGHQQMMTDAMKPLGLSFFLLITRAPMRKAGGRLFVDITAGLASPSGRQNLLEVLGQSDPLIKDALMTLIARGDFIAPAPDGEPTRIRSSKGMSTADILAQAEHDPAVATNFISDSQAAVAALKQNIATKSGTALFDFILEDIAKLKERMFRPENMRLLMTAIDASYWINEKMNEWLGEKNAADILSQSVSGNVTSEMGLALLDLADVLRPHPEVIAYLQRGRLENFPEDLLQFEGGRESYEALRAYLDKYGMRCSGEIDITKTRWQEKPATLVPVLLNNIKNFEPGAGPAKFEQGLQEALAKEQELLERLAALPEGEEKVRATRTMIGLVRNFIGYREYPKYNLVCHTFLYKQALLKEADRLTQAGILHEPEDIYYLNFEELRGLVAHRRPDYEEIARRKAAFRIYEKLNPPRVITSDGEIITGAYKHEDLPEGALAGLPVSSGLIEGRARVIVTMENADLEEGDILVTTFTDPSWTPLFVSVKGLVTEVGGLMTHGAVIAREYGLPAVVGVEQATQLIRDGQRIRVNGTDGYVELL